jgi:hypothetical protein
MSTTFMSTTQAATTFKDIPVIDILPLASDGLARSELSRTVAIPGARVLFRVARH